MGKLIVAFCCLGMLFFVGCRKNSAESARGNSANLAANFSLPLLNSQSQWDLASLLGQKTILLTFFATWCPYCNTSMPYLENFYEKSNTNNFEMIGVNLQEDKEKVEKFQKKFGLTFPIVLAKDVSVFAESYPVRFLPTFYLINREGVMLRKFEGFHPEILDAVSKAINN